MKNNCYYEGFPILKEPNFKDSQQRDQYYDLEDRIEELTGTKTFKNLRTALFIYSTSFNAQYVQFLLYTQPVISNRNEKGDMVTKCLGEPIKFLGTYSAIDYVIRAIKFNEKKHNPISICSILQQYKGKILEIYDDEIPDSFLKEELRTNYSEFDFMKQEDVNRFVEGLKDWKQPDIEDLFEHDTTVDKKKVRDMKPIYLEEELPF